MTKSGSFHPFDGDVGEQRYAELFDRYKQQLGWIGVLLIMVAGGVWFYFRSQSLKSQRAEAAYEAAVQSVASGNIPLAQSDLKKAAARYAGTIGGTESAMALAKTYYQQGKYQDGITALADPASSKGELQYEAILLTASGYESLNQWAKAAKAYETAAAAARFDADRASARAMAARAYQAGGDKTAATRIWTDLLTDPKGTFTTEAKIRLGELAATPIKV
jgi:tetratricopeptide (TPR) repeat protein